MTAVIYCIQNIFQKSSCKAGRQRDFLLLNGTLFSNWSAQHVTLNQTPENLIEGLGIFDGFWRLSFIQGHPYSDQFHAFHPIKFFVVFFGSPVLEIFTGSLAFIPILKFH